MAKAPVCSGEERQVLRETHVRVPLRRLVSWSRWAFAAAILVSLCSGLFRGTTQGGAQIARRSLAEQQDQSAASGHASEPEEAETLEGKMSFLSVCFLMSCLLHQLNNSLPDVMTLPLTVLIFLVGMLVGVIFLEGVGWKGNDLDDLIQGMRDASSINPHALLFIVLPPLLYESAAAMNWRVLRKLLPSAMILAGPGVVLNTAITGLFAKASLTVGDTAVSWESSFLLASILSATDPVAVVAALHDLGAPKKLATLIEGESLMNDGSAVVFFFVFLDLVATEAPDSDKQCAGVPPSASCIILYFFRLAVGAFALGGAVSIIVYAWIAQAEADRHAEVLEVAVVLVAVYGTFFLAESIHVSGVLAVVMFGMMSTAFISASMSSHGRHSHHIVFRQISYACNQVIFFSAGMITARFMWTDGEDGSEALFKQSKHWFELLVMYVAIHVSRALVILLFSPLLTRLGYGITPKEGIIMVWGGLRGAVGLTLGLLVEDNDFVDAGVSSTIAFHVSGIVMLTLLVNGTTVEFIYKRLRLYPPNPFRMTYLRKVLSTLEKEFVSPFSKKGLMQMKSDWFFRDAEFAIITQCAPNFRLIDFDPAGIPYPTGLQTVSECLHSLEAPKKKLMIGSFRQNWNHEKSLGRSALMDCLRSTASKAADLKDVMNHVTNTGDQRLEFRGFTTGMYASVRPLTRIRASPTLQRVSGREKALGFSVMIHKAELLSLHVGLVVGLEAAQQVDSLPLGLANDSVGFDCGSGKLRVNGVEGPMEHAVEYCNRCHLFTAVHVMVVQEPGEEWEIVFMADFRNEVVLLKRVCLGPYPPADLYPSIQFLDSDEHDSFTTPRRLRTTHSIGDLSLIAQAQSKAKHAIVSLSYELQTASERETLNQIFHAIFNTVLHQYREMHECGLIGNESLAWLEQATGEALDCADSELHHIKAADFSRLRSTDAILANAETSSRPMTPRHKEVCLELARVKSCTDAPGSYITLFEPVIVEYMHLELACSGASFWDAFPQTSDFIRRRGYGYILTKVESLWAFVQAHERVLRESAAIERHPHLITCMKAIIAEAKGDLEIIHSLKPRRFFYCKQYLALRVIMRRKLERLVSFVEEGWLSTEDSVKLEEALWDRIHAIKHFVPRSSAAAERKEKEKSGRSRSKEDSDTYDVVLPAGISSAPESSGPEDSGEEQPLQPPQHPDPQPDMYRSNRRHSTVARDFDILGGLADLSHEVETLGDQSFSLAAFALNSQALADSEGHQSAQLTPSPFVLPHLVPEEAEESTASTSDASSKVMAVDSVEKQP